MEPQDLEGGLQLRMTLVLYLEHNSIFFQWGVGLMGQLSLGRSAPSTLEDALRVWLTHPGETQ